MMVKRQSRGTNVRKVGHGNYHSKGKFTTGFIGRMFNQLASEGGYAQAFIQKRYHANGDELPNLFSELGTSVKILDLGCGGFADGLLLKELFESNGKKTSIRGVELDDQIVEMVKNTGGKKLSYKKSPDFHLGEYRQLVNSYAGKYFEGDNDLGWYANQKLIEELNSDKQDGTYFEVVQGDMTSSDFLNTHKKQDVILTIVSLCYVKDKDKAVSNILNSLEEEGFWISDYGIFQKKKNEIRVAYDNRYHKLRTKSGHEFTQMIPQESERGEIYKAISNSGYQLLMKNHHLDTFS
ncbi:MAG: methyltransferase domain-containing protein [Candidatus Altiarchaeota archaeon]|nr:methyltransferase domain-containing protein [Candidatus Altiarchaeota archaeon]